MFNPGDEVLFKVHSELLQADLELYGRVTAVHPDGTVRVASASGLVSGTFPPCQVTPLVPNEECNP